MLTPGTSKLGRKYGYRPPQENHPMVRLSRRAAGFPLSTAGAISWRPLMRPVRDQGQEGSCFAHAVAALKEFSCVKWEEAQGNPALPLGSYLSVAYLSWRTRLAEGTFPADSGASLADAMAVLKAWGTCPEAFLPYDANPAQAGTAVSDVAAQPYRCGEPLTVDLDAVSWRQVLGAKKLIAIGFQVPASFEDTGADGMVPQQTPGEPILGGHAVLVTGWDPDRGFEVRNSWGQDWGDGGYCWFPESYLSQVWESWTTA